MNELKTVTSQYIALEDRLRLLGETAAGESYTLWLSGRLLRNLVPSLVSWLIPSSSNQSYQAVMQEAAKAKQEQCSPVVAQTAAHVWLVHQVDLQDLGQTLGLVFSCPGPPKHKVCWFLNNTGLRQWLNILYSQTQQAQWVGIDWPDWLEPPTITEAPEGVALH
jgi:hypothetical protein